LAFVRSTPRAASSLVVSIALLTACGGTKEQPAADTAAAAPAAAPAADTAAPAPATATATTVANGAEVYARCSVCHQPTGEGAMGAFPPLKGSEWVLNNPEVPIRILLHGLNGPIKVAGNDYNAQMMAGGAGVPLSDDELAAVLTHVRSSWGNSAPAVTPAEVAAVRAATSGRTTPWTAAELEPLLKK
jgi:mono/diheme cytochrome c family protein